MAESVPSISVGDVQLGAQVYGAEGKHLGDVNEVVNDPSGDELYFEVDRGGILGFGGKKLYVPFSAISELGAGSSVHLTCTTDEAEQRYAQKPGS